MARGGDWSVLGFGKDPTPGDPTVIQEIQTKMDDLKQLSGNVNDGLTALLNQGEGKFVGKTADALREKISGELKTFIGALYESFDIAGSAMSTYRTKMEEAQSKADAAFQAAQALDKNAEDYQTQLAKPKQDAMDAKTDLEGANRTMEGELRRAGQKVKLPVSGWKIFWEVFSILAMTVSVVAIFVGGPLGLLAFALNGALFAKTAVDFAQGKASGLELGLAALGLLGPTTKAISLVGVLKGIGAGAKVLVTGAAKGFVLTAKGFAQVLPNPSVVGQAFLATTKAVPGMLGSALKAVPALLASAAGFVKGTWNSLLLAAKRDFFLSTWAASGTGGKLGAYVLTLGGRAFDLAVSAVMPLHYGELAVAGYQGAFKLAVLERGFGLAGTDLAKLAVGQGVRGGMELLHPGMSGVNPMNAHLGVLGGELHLGTAGFGTNGFSHLAETGPLGLGTSALPSLRGVSSGLGGELGHGLTSTIGTDLGHGLGGNLGNNLVHGVSAVDNLKAIDQYTGLARTDSGLLVPKTHLDGLGGSGSSLGGHGLDLSGRSLTPTHLESTAVRTTGAGQGLNFAHNAVKQAEFGFELAIPELKAIANGDVHITNVSHHGITLQIGEVPEHAQALSTGLQNAPSLHGTPSPHGLDTPGAMSHSPGGALPGNPANHLLDSPGPMNHAVGLGAHPNPSVQLLDNPGAMNHAVGIRPTPALHLPDNPGPMNHALDVGPKTALDTGPKAGLGDFRTSATPSATHDPVASRNLAMDLLGDGHGPKPATTGASSPLGETSTATGHLDHAGSKGPGLELGGTEGSGSAVLTAPEPLAVRPEPGPQPSALHLLDDGGHGLPESTPPLAKGKQPELFQPTTHDPSVDTRGGSTVAANMDLYRQGHFEVITGGNAGPAGIERFRAWLHYEQSLSDLGHAQDALGRLDHVGESSTGVSPAEALARLEVSKAELKLANAEHALGTLGMDPAVVRHDLAAMATAVPSDMGGRLRGGMLQPTPSVPLTTAELNGTRIVTGTGDGTPRLMRGNDVVLNSTVLRNGDHFVVDLGDGTRWVHAEDGAHLATDTRFGGQDAYVRNGLDGSFAVVDRAGDAHPGFTVTPVDTAGGHIVTTNADHTSVLMNGPDHVPNSTVTTNQAGNLVVETPAGRWVHGADGTHLATETAFQGHPDLFVRNGTDGSLAVVDRAGDPHPGFTVTTDGGGHLVSDGTDRWRFGADGTLRFHDRALTGAGPDGVSHVRIADGAPPVAVDGTGAVVGTHTVVAEGGGHTITNADLSTRWHYGADNALLHTDHRLTGPVTPGADWHLRTTPGGEATLVDGTGATVGSHQLTPGGHGGAGGHTVTDGAGQSWHYDRTGGLVRHDTPVTGAGGTLNPPADWHLSTRYDGPGAPTHSLVDGTGADLGHTLAPGGVGGGHTVTDASGHVWHLDADGTVQAKDLSLGGRGPEGATHLRDAFGPNGHEYTVIDGTGTAVPGHDVEFRPGPSSAPLGGPTIRDTATGNRWHFDGEGALTSQEITLRPYHGGDNPQGHTTITVNHGDPLNPTAHAPGGDHALTVDRFPNGDVRGFSLRGDDALGTGRGDVWHYNADGGMASFEKVMAGNEHLPMGHPAGIRETPGVGGGDPVLRAVDGDGRVLHGTVTKDGDRFVFTDARPHTTGNTVTFDRAGLLVEEKIGIRGPGGRPTGEAWVIDHTTGLARKVDAAGNGAWGHYVQGQAQLMGEGKLRIVSSGRTQFEREILLNGHVLQVDADRAGGAMRWHSYDPRDVGGVGAPNSYRSGNRIFDPDRHTIRDYDGSKVVRDYHLAPDGGHIRAQARPNPTWHDAFQNKRWDWERFDRDGNLLLSGTRQHYGTGAFYDYVVDGATGEKIYAQAKNSAAAGLDSLNKYRVFDVARDADGVAHVNPDKYLEFSAQNKPTAFKDELSGGGSIEVRRLAEQRMPASRWHSQAGLDKFHGGFANSTFTGDSLNQVFKWTETRADGSIITGIRKTSPDGSWVDLDQFGRAVRGERKLSDGTTVQFGKDRANPNQWSQSPVPPHPTADGYAGYTLHWSSSNGTSGTRLVDSNGHWQDVFQGHDGQLYVAQREVNGGWREYRGEHPLANNADDSGLWVDKNDLNQITGRRDQWGDQYVQAHGNPRRTDWTWTSYDADGNQLATGKRLNNRGAANSRTWDDSFKDFDAGGALVREHNELTPNHWTDVSAIRNPNGTTTYHVQHVGPGGDVVDGTRAYTGGHGAGGGDHWTDTVDGLVIRTRDGGKIREFGHTLTDHPVNQAGQHGVTAVDRNVWREFDQGKPVRSKTELAPAADGVPARYRETDHVWGQWREYSGQNLVAQKTISGRIWQTDAFGQWNATKFWAEHQQFPKVDPARFVGENGHTGWRIAGRDMDFRGGVSEFRGFNREMKDAWHELWTGTVAGGGESRFMPHGVQVLRKAAIDFGTGFVLDFAASTVVNLAEAGINHRDPSPLDFAKAVVSGVVGGVVKGGLTALYDLTPAGKFRYGVWNVDFGKNFNRHNYASVDDWATEWTSHEFPVRWRTASYDISTGILSSFVSGFLGNTINAAAFGVNGQHLYGGTALLAGAWGGLGSLASASTIGLTKNIANVYMGSRLYHRGGLGELGMFFTESLAEKTASKALLNAANIKPALAIPAPPPPPVPTDEPARALVTPLDDIPDTFLNHSEAS
ncbi:putative T7SS-secreted protein [Kitasatospora sp. NPDC089509]|uniref:putative T7SS-secreted protein n=1 Tax=Kitasatospora sp. NPDC089509 TaxID=3364079 RepID=UPI00381C1FF4